jgi:hypothetical protein
LELVRRACAAFPHSALLATLLGQALRLAGQHAEAYQQLARALELHRAALTYRAEFPKEDETVHYWEFGAHIQGLSDQRASETCHLTYRYPCSLTVGQVADLPHSRYFVA